jgi:hypothetical protein
MLIAKYRRNTQAWPILVKQGIFNSKTPLAVLPPNVRRIQALEEAAYLAVATNRPNNGLLFLDEEPRTDSPTQWDIVIILISPNIEAAK